MSKITRIFIDAKSKTILHANETDQTINSISRTPVIGERQLGDGRKVLDNWIKDGDFVEVTADNLVVKKCLNEDELEAITSMLCAKLGSISGEKFNLLKSHLEALDKGELPANPTVATKPKPKEDQLSESARDLITKEGLLVAKEFDERGIVDWRVRDSLLASFRTKVRRNLQKNHGRKIFLASVVNRQLENLLTTTSQL